MFKLDSKRTEERYCTGTEQHISSGQVEPAFRLGSRVFPNVVSLILAIALCRVWLREFGEHDVYWRSCMSGPLRLLD